MGTVSARRWTAAFALVLIGSISSSSSKALPSPAVTVTTIDQALSLPTIFV